jgi:hypothetical protein
MNALKLETTIDEATAEALPSLRQLLGKRVEMIVLEAEPVASPGLSKILSFEDLLSRRIKAPEDSVPLSQADIDAAILEGVRPRRQPGSAKELIKLKDDFNHPLEDFEAYR